jgi:hypothetical protein
VLVRSARAYQEALWIAESDPRQAWLRLVSAVEAIAGLAPDAPAADRLKAAHPDIADRVMRTNDPELIEWTAARFADQGRSTAKFRDFLKKFQPPPPRRRPATPSNRVDWRTLDKQMQRIYGYRSSDLHKGEPFPESMCHPPFVSSRKIAHEVAYTTKDWKGAAPIHLHMFEYIVRRAIQGWWRWVASRQSTAEQQTGVSGSSAFRHGATRDRGRSGADSGGHGAAVAAVVPAAAANAPIPVWGRGRSSSTISSQNTYDGDTR